MSSVGLEYYVDIDGLRQVYGSKRDEEASDAWYLHHYLAEIRQLRRFARASSDPSSFPRKEKYFLLYGLLLSMTATMPTPRVTELGSSLLEIIDGLEAAHALFQPLYEFPCCSFLGIEKSEFLVDVAQLLHPDHDITLVSSTDSMYARFPDGVGGVVYDRIVSSSAFRSVESFAKFLKGFDAGILNLLTSREETFVSNFFGAEYTYFSLRELDRLMSHSLFHLFGLRAPKHAELRTTGRPVVEGFFFYGDGNRLSAFVEQCQAFSVIRQFFAEKEISPKPISLFL